MGQKNITQRLGPKKSLNLFEQKKLCNLLGQKKSRNLSGEKKNHAISWDKKSHKKRSRARVTIEGQCVLLQISHQIKMFNFLLNS